MTARHHRFALAAPWVLSAAASAAAVAPPAGSPCPGRGASARGPLSTDRAARLHAGGLGRDHLGGGSRGDRLARRVPSRPDRVGDHASALVKAHGPFRSLFVNSERRPRPRLPKEGFWRIESVPGRTLAGDHWKTLFEGSDAFVAAPGTVEPWRNLADVEAVVPRDGSSTLRAPASGPTRPSSRCPFSRPCSGSRAGRSRSASSKDCASWASPSSTPPSPRPARRAGRVGRRRVTLVLRGARNVAIEDRRLRRPRRLRRRDRRREPGRARRRQRRSRDVGAGGVKVGGSRRGGRSRACGRQRSRSPTITSMRSAASRRARWGSSSATPSDIAIAHNHVHDTCYTRSPRAGSGATRRASRARYGSRRTTSTTSARGCCPTWVASTPSASQPGCVVRGNLIHDVKAAGYGGWAIYPDEGSSHVVIEDNVAFDTTAHVFHQHYGNENAVRNNVFAFGGEGVLALSRGPGHDGGRGALAFTLRAEHPRHRRPAGRRDRPRGAARPRP